jgi:NADH dehydrogenase
MTFQSATQDASMGDFVRLEECAGETGPQAKLLAKDGSLHRIIVVGGGAAGLELATRLGDKLGRRGRAEIFLVDRYLHHIWKPLLHEVAAGALGEGNEVSYLAQARGHHFRFRFGTMDGLDRARKLIHLAATFDEDGNRVNPRRIIPYDTLVLALGSLTNDFGVPGVKEFAWPLNDARDARRFHRRLLAACVHSQILDGEEPLDIVIVGAGATGVELAAELYHTTRQFISYGLDKIDPARIRITLISSTPRILPGLPRGLSNSVQAQLQRMDIDILCNERVVEVRQNEVLTAVGRRLPALVTVWAGGIKAPDFLHELDGLETNRLNQLVVAPSLQTTRDEAIYAMGDCAAAAWHGLPEGTLVPPRAQAAHQQAALLARNLERRLENKAQAEFRYRDFGSLVSLGRSGVVGSLIGMSSKPGTLIQGAFARFMYWVLYQKHLLVLHGFFRVALTTLSRLILQPVQSHVKLH